MDDSYRSITRDTESMLLIHRRNETIHLNLFKQIPAHRKSLDFTHCNWSYVDFMVDSDRVPICTCLMQGLIVCMSRILTQNLKSLQSHSPATSTCSTYCFPPLTASSFVEKLADSTRRRSASIASAGRWCCFATLRRGFIEVVVEVFEGSVCCFWV
jgi:hypothetical protein